jgi:hypothetical protein
MSWLVANLKPKLSTNLTAVSTSLTAVSTSLTAGGFKHIAHPSDHAVLDWLMQWNPRCWIAGGTVLNWYLQRPCDSDMDLFFSQQTDFEHLQQRLAKIHCQPSLYSHWHVTQHRTSDNAVTFVVQQHNGGPSHTLQLVHRKFYATAAAVIDDFDITVCQICTDGQQVTTGQWFAQDVSARRLRYHKLSTGSAKRLIKYWVYGYEPTDLEISMINNSKDLNWSAGDDDY